MTTMRSAAGILRAFWRVNLAEELQYRANFIASLLGTLFWMATAMLTLAVFFNQTDSLGGWPFWDVVVLLGVFTTLAGVVEALFRPSIGRIAEYVRTGSLDLILVRPIDTQLFVSFRRLDVWRLTDVALGLGLSGYALTRLDAMPGAVEVIAFAIMLACAVAIVYAIWLALMSLAFWLVAVENLSVVFDALFEAARYPVTAYPGALRFLFVYLIPIAWTTTIPASALTGRLTPVTAALAVVSAGLALAITRLFWRIALSRYTSAGG
jgi:ABC-2 type transport system permease protein